MPTPPARNCWKCPTSVGKLVFGSDAYSSWEAIRDWEVANIQQTDSVQQFLAYEKCYKITGGYQNCVAAHEPLSYTDKYPLTKNSWVGMNGGAWPRSRWHRRSLAQEVSLRMLHRRHRGDLAPRVSFRATGRRIPGRRITGLRPHLGRAGQGLASSGRHATIERLRLHRRFRVAAAA